MAAPTVAGPPASSTRWTSTPLAQARLRVWPIGTCHGLNSPHSPRIVTSMSSGKRQICAQRQHVDAVADAADLHQQHAALAAEPGAGGERDALLLGRQHDGGIAASAWHSSISRLWPASGT